MNSNTRHALLLLGFAFLAVFAACGQTGSDPSRLTSPDADDPKDERLSEVARVVIIPAHVALGIGVGRQLNAIVYDSAAVPLHDREIRWSSSDTAIASVDETGLVRGVGVGAATVTASCDDKEGDARVVVRSVSVLIDASRDGGVWWFPQGGSFDPDLPHQGKPLADYLRSFDLEVRELPRPTQISLDLLQGYSLVIRAVAFGGYTSSEVLAYQQYVERGGRLLLLDDHKRYAGVDAVGESFGLLFAGITRGSQGLVFVNDPVTEGLQDGQLFFLAGSGLAEYPATAKILAYLDENSYLDLNANGSRDDGEPVAPPVIGRLEAGDGLVVFMGDTNFIERVPQPLTDNFIRFFLPDVVANLSEMGSATFSLANPPCVAGCS